MFKPDKNSIKLQSVSELDREVCISREKSRDTVMTFVKSLAEEVGGIVSGVQWQSNFNPGIVFNYEPFSTAGMNAIIQISFQSETHALYFDWRFEKYFSKAEEYDYLLELDSSKEIKELGGEYAELELIV